VHAMTGQIEAEWLRLFRAKLALSDARAGDQALIEDLLRRMVAGQADFTNSFRALGTARARDQFLEPAAYDGWEEAWRARRDGLPAAGPMIAAANPGFIPRNHRVEQMIAAAVEGDYAPFHRLNAVLARPYDDQPEARDLTRPPLPGEAVEATFCGT